MKIYRQAIPVIMLFALMFPLSSSAQTIKSKVIDLYDAATVCKTYEIVRHIEASEQQQISIAEKIQEESKLYVQALKESDGILTNDQERALKKFHKGWFTTLLTKAQQEMYWRGQFDKECTKEGNRIANQIAIANPKFDTPSRKTTASVLRSIFLDYKVIESMYVKTKKIQDLKQKAWEKWTGILAEKTGWKLSSDYTVEDIWKTDRSIPRMD